jgi:hypothetical protein
LENIEEYSTFPRYRYETESGLPDFSCYNIPKRGKIYLNGKKYTKTGENMPNNHKIYKMAVK